MSEDTYKTTNLGGVPSKSWGSDLIDEYVLQPSWWWWGSRASQARAGHSPQVNLKQSFGVEVSCCHWMSMQRDLGCRCRWWPKACHVHTERASGDRLPGQKPCRQSQGNTVDRRSRVPVSMLKETMKDGHQSEPVFLRLLRDHGWSRAPPNPFTSMLLANHAATGTCNRSLFAPALSLQYPLL